MALFDDVTGEYHECGVDNLYMSAKFCREAYNHTNKIKRKAVGSSAMISVMMATLSNSTSATSHHQSSIHPLDYLPSMLE